MADFDFSDLNLDFLQTTPPKNVQVHKSLNSPLKNCELVIGPKQISSKKSKKISNWAQKIASTDRLLTEIKKLKCEKLELQKQLKDLQGSALAVQNLYTAENKAKNLNAKKLQQLQEKFEQVDAELAVKSLQCDQLEGELAMHKDRPIDYNTLVIKYLRLLNKLDEEEVQRNCTDRLMIENLRQYCTNYRLKAPPAPLTPKMTKSKKLQKQATQREFMKDMPITIKPSMTNQSTQCEVETRSQGCQHISTMTTRATTTACFIKYRTVGTSFPEPQPIPIVEEILKEFVPWQNITPISPIADRPVKKEKNKKRKKFKSVGTCTWLCNVTRKVDFLPHKQQRSAMCDVSTTACIKQEVTTPAPSPTPNVPTSITSIQNNISSAPAQGRTTASTSGENSASFYTLLNALQSSLPLRELTDSPLDSLWQNFVRLFMSFMQVSNAGIATIAANQELVNQQHFNRWLRELYENSASTSAHNVAQQVAGLYSTQNVATSPINVHTLEPSEIDTGNSEALNSSHTVATSPIHFNQISPFDSPNLIRPQPIRTFVCEEECRNEEGISHEEPTQTSFSAPEKITHETNFDSIDSAFHLSTNTTSHNDQSENPKKKHKKKRNKKHELSDERLNRKSKHKALKRLLKAQKHKKSIEEIRDSSRTTGQLPFKIEETETAVDFLTKIFENSKENNVKIGEIDKIPKPKLEVSTNNVNVPLSSIESLSANNSGGKDLDDSLNFKKPKNMHKNLSLLKQDSISKDINVANKNELYASLFGESASEMEEDDADDGDNMNECHQKKEFIFSLRDQQISTPDESNLGNHQRFLAHNAKADVKHYKSTNGNSSSFLKTIDTSLARNPKNFGKFKFEKETQERLEEHIDLEDKLQHDSLEDSRCDFDIDSGLLLIDNDEAALENVDAAPYKTFLGKTSCVSYSKMENCNNIGRFMRDQQIPTANQSNLRNDQWFLANNEETDVNRYKCMNGNSSTFLKTIETLPRYRETLLEKETQEKLEGDIDLEDKLQDDPLEDSRNSDIDSGLLLIDNDEAASENVDAATFKTSSEETSCMPYSKMGRYNNIGTSLDHQQISTPDVLNLRNYYNLMNGKSKSFSKTVDTSLARNPEDLLEKETKERLEGDIHFEDKLQDDSLEDSRDSDIDSGLLFIDNDEAASENVDAATFKTSSEETSCMPYSKKGSYKNIGTSLHHLQISTPDDLNLRNYQRFNANKEEAEVKHYKTMNENSKSVLKTIETSVARNPEKETQQRLEEDIGLEGKLQDYSLEYSCDSDIDSGLLLIDNDGAALENVDAATFKTYSEETSCMPYSKMVNCSNIGAVTILKENNLSIDIASKNNEKRTRTRSSERKRENHTEEQLPCKRLEDDIDLEDELQADSLEDSRDSNIDSGLLLIDNDEPVLENLDAATIKTSTETSCVSYSKMGNCSNIGAVTILQENNLSFDIPSKPPRTRGCKRKRENHTKEQLPCKRSERLKARNRTLSITPIEIGKYTRVNKTKTLKDKTKTVETPVATKIKDDNKSDDTKPQQEENDLSKMRLGYFNEINDQPKVDTICPLMSIASCAQTDKIDLAHATDSNRSANDQRILRQTQLDPLKTEIYPLSLSANSEKHSVKKRPVINFESYEDNEHNEFKTTNPLSIDTNADVNYNDSPLSPTPQDNNMDTEINIASLDIPLELSPDYRPSAKTKNLLENLIDHYSPAHFKRIITNFTQTAEIFTKREQLILMQYESILKAYCCSSQQLDFDIMASEVFRKLQSSNSMEYSLLCKAIINTAKNAEASKMKDNEMSSILYEMPPRHFSSSLQRLYYLLHGVNIVKPTFCMEILMKIDCTIFNVSQNEKPSLTGIVHLIQLYLICCKLAETNHDKHPARILIAKCLYFYSLKAIPMIHEILMWHPTALPPKEDRTYDRSDALITVIQQLLMSTTYDVENEELRCKALLSKLRFEYHYTPYTPKLDETINNLIAKLKMSKFCNLSLAFSLLCKRMHPKRTEILLQTELLPLANEYFNKALENTMAYDENIANILDIISKVVKPLPADSDVDIYLKLFSRCLSTFYRPLIQESAVCAIIRLQRFGYINCFNRLIAFKPTFEISPPTRAMLRTFIHRQPLSFLKSLVNQCHVNFT